MSEDRANVSSPLQAAIVRVTPFEQNCTLIWDEATKIGAVVDPGGDLDRIEGAIKDVGMKVEKILLTHGHIDHAGGAADLRDTLGVKIEGPHKNDAVLLDALEKQGQMYGISGVRNVTPDRWLDEGETVTVAGHTF
ncbi:MAG TPA: MBL fold metallo-hydrolase, partial [Hyphomicrobium sp.]|nr:MBL fold metallo-hydrolase [Hyphomicrobium sp.]